MRLHYSLAKRIIDILVSLLALVLFSPLWIVMALSIRVESAGTILFRQRRIGRNGIEFNIFKFRTMTQNAPPDTPTHLLTDPASHITRVGRLLRRYSLDEIPQFINVLLGDMSLIGPRPALWNQYDLIALRRKNGASALRPGITGWAQVRGRDTLSMDAKAEHDSYYSSHISFGLDSKILLLTIMNVFLAKGVAEGAASCEENNRNWSK